MAAVVKILSISAAGPQLRVLFNITLSGNYPAGGDIIDFTQATKDPNFQGISEVVESSLAPQNLDVWDQGGLINNQVTAIRGTTPANCKVKIGAAASFGTEFSAGAYSAALLAATLTGEAVFAKLI